ncbi:MAG: EpsG family protein [Thermoguttaceae bacterium]
MIVWGGLLLWITFIKLCLGNLHLCGRKKLFLLLSGLGIVFVMGARYADPAGDGDLNNYARVYQIAQKVPLNDLFSIVNMEPGYLVFNKMFSMFFSSYQTIIFLEAIICVFFISRFIYFYCDEAYLALLMFFAQGLFIFELTGFRQTIAISLVLYSIDFILKRKFFLFLITSAVAFTIHSSVVCFIPFYFLSDFKPNLKTSFIYFVSYLVMINMISILLSWGSNIVDTDYSELTPTQTIIGPAINITFYVVSMWLILRAKTRGRVIESWKWNMLNIGLITYVLRFISSIFERVSFYYSVGSVIVFPEEIISVFSPKSKRIAYMCVVLILSFLFLYRIQTTAGLDYRFFWEK